MPLDYQRVVLALDFDRLTPGGLLYDYSRYALHLTPGAGAAAPTRNVNGGFDFDGGDRFEMDAVTMARFYAVAPLGAFTVAWVCNFTTTAGAADRIFSCWNSTAGGVDRGIVAAVLTSAAAGRARAYQMQGAAAQPYVASAAAEPYLRVGGRSCCILTVEAAPLGMINDQRAAAAWAVGAFGAAVYDAAIVPRIGMDPAGTNPFTGRARYFLLYDGALTEDDQRQLMTHMVENRQAFCWRRP